MNTARLFENIEFIGELPDGEICSVEQDSRKVKKGSVFVCTKGITSDGHQFAQKALSNGACVIVCEHTLGLDREVLVKDTRKAYAILCQNFFERPADSLRLLAVTGTNGKTTTTTVLKQLLTKAGYKCGLIGTIQSEIDTMEIPAKYTTPEPWDLNALLARMKAAGCTFVVMEASSHALQQLRLYGLHFECGGFTNLTQDHLDYHGTLEEYFKAKEKLFDNCDIVVTNIDDEHGKRVAKDYAHKKVITFSASDDTADYTAHNTEFKANCVKFEMVGKNSINRVVFPMPGDYSVHNALTAGAMALAVGLTPMQVSEGLSQCTGVRGRCEVVYHGDFTIIIDYAHTPDGIEKVLSSLKPFVKGRLVALFGCAGERDAKKRPIMSKAAAAYADVIMLTSDNPRSENPYEILAHAEPTLHESGKEYYVEVERRMALQKTLAMLKKDDVLVLCGKGHEDYQVIDGITIYLDEHRIVNDWLVQNNLK